MKRLLIATILLSLMGCESDSDSTDPFINSGSQVEDSDDKDIILPQNPDPSFPDPFDLDITVSDFSRNTRNIEISWSALPENYTYTLCEHDSTKENNCNAIKTGDATDNPVVTLQLGVETSLHQLLENTLFIYFEDPTASTNYIDAFNLNFTSEDINRLVQFLKAIEPDTGEQFGFSVALSEDGNTLVVGSRNQDSNNLGGIYIFADSSTGWQQQIFISHPFPDINDIFGKYIALSANADVIAISIPGDDASSSDLVVPDTVNDPDGTAGFFVPNNQLKNAGAIAMLGRTGNTWEFTAILKSEILTPLNQIKEDNDCDFNQPEDELSEICKQNLADFTEVENMQFGRNSLALSKDGKTLAVGHYSGIEDADLDTNNTDKNERVEIFVDNSGTWEYLQTLEADATAINDFFGYGIAMNEDASVLAISAILDDSDNSINPTNNALSDSGSVYIYNKVLNSYTLVKYLKPETPLPQQEFGTGIDLSNDGTILAVGASGSNNAYLFSANGNAWTQMDIILNPNDADDDNFGNNVALNDDASRLMISTNDRFKAVGINDMTAFLGLIPVGGVYVYDLTQGTLIPQAYLKPLTSPDKILSPMFGFSIEADGAAIDKAENFNSIDMNGNGRVLVVGAPGDNSNSTRLNGNPDSTGFSNSGAVYLYYF